MRVIGELLDNLSRVLLPQAVRASLRRILPEAASESADTVALDDLLQALLAGPLVSCSIAAFTADAGLARVLQPALASLIRSRGFRLLVSSSDFVTPALATVLATALPKSNRAEAGSLGTALLDTLRVAPAEQPLLHAKVYIFRLRFAHQITRLAVIGSANPTACGLLKSHELSTLLVEDNGSARAFDWLDAWFLQLWDLGIPYLLPPSPPARVDAPLSLLPYQQQVHAWLDRRWAVAPAQPLQLLRRDEVRLPGHLIVLPTGTGKTRLTIEWISSRWKDGEAIEVLWVTHLGELVKQTRRHFAPLLGATPEGRRYSDGEHRDGRRTAPAPDALRVETRQAAARLGPTAVDILVIDEAHHLGLAGIQYPALLKNVQARMIIGPTATPWRTSVGGVEDSSVDRLFPNNDEHRCEPLTLAEAVNPAGGPVLAHLFRHVVDTGLTMQLTGEETSFRVTEGNRTFAQFVTPEAVRLVAAT
jgi:hypothetical protein